MAQADRLHANLPERYGSWAEHGRSWASPGLPYRVVRVRYEDLLAVPEAAFGLLADAAGLQFKRARCVVNSTTRRTSNYPHWRGCDGRFPLYLGWAHGQRSIPVRGQWKRSQGTHQRPWSVTHAPG